MEIYVMDAFSDRIFGGNQAGVALPERELPDGTMQAVAAEMKHSETAFVRLAPDGVHLRYFTPAGEVDLCGHATVGSFALLRALGKIGDGMHTAHTRAGTLRVEVAGGTVWMDMAPPKLLQTLPQDVFGGNVVRVIVIAIERQHAAGKKVHHIEPRSLHNHIPYKGFRQTAK